MHNVVFPIFGFAYAPHAAADVPAVLSRSAFRAALNLGGGAGVPFSQMGAAQAVALQELSRGCSMPLWLMIKHYEEAAVACSAHTAPVCEVCHG